MFYLDKYVVEHPAYKKGRRTLFQEKIEMCDFNAIS